jgi:DNA-binding phage protein
MMGKSHDEYMIERFREDPNFAAALVNDILENGDDQGELKIILGLITSAGIQLSVIPVTPKPRHRTATAKRKTPNR